MVQKCYNLIFLKETFEPLKRKFHKNFHVTRCFHVVFMISLTVCLEKCQTTIKFIEVTEVHQQRFSMIHTNFGSANFYVEQNKIYFD